MNKILNNTKFLIVIWGFTKSFGNYDDEIYRKPLSQINLDDVEMWTALPDEPDILLNYWELLLGKYEGLTYAVYDLDNSGEHIITGGVFDPNDDDIIRDYLGL